MLVFVQEIDRKGQVIEIPVGWQCACPAGEPVTFSKLITVERRKQTKATRAAIGTNGLLMGWMSLVIESTLRNEKEFVIEFPGERYIMGVKLPEAKAIAGQYLGSWQGDDGDGNPVGLMTFEEVQAAKEAIIHKGIAEQKDSFDFPVKTFVTERGVTRYNTVTVPARRFGGLALHRALHSVEYAVSHIATTAGIIRVPSIKAGEAAIKALTGTGIDWTIEDNEKMQDEAREKGLGDVISRLREEGVLC
jgi:hypothetical protein